MALVIDQTDFGGQCQVLRVCSAHSDDYHEQLGGKQRVGAPQQSERASIFDEPHRALFRSFQNQLNAQNLAA